MNQNRTITTLEVGLLLPDPLQSISFNNVGASESIFIVKTRQLHYP